MTRPRAARDHLARGLRAGYFAELVELGGSTALEPQDRAALAARYGLEVDPQSVPELISRFDLVFPGEQL